MSSASLAALSTPARTDTAIEHRTVGSSLQPGVRKVPITMRLTPEQEAAYSLDYGISRADLKPEVQAAYDRLKQERQLRPADSTLAPVNVAAQTKIYRPQSVSIILGGAAAATFFVVGLSGVTVGASQHDGAGSVVVGAVAVLFSLCLGVTLATNRLVVTAAGLVYWNNLRRRFIGWPEIRSFGVGPGRSVARYPCPIIYLNVGKVTVTSLASFTAKRPTGIVGQLTAFQRDLAPAGYVLDNASSQSST
jgi:hypothetical protein